MQIEKVDGCDHMTCHRPVGCGYEFCWICLADYGPIRREGKHKHSTDCQHFAGRPQERGNPDALPRARELQRHRMRCRWGTPVIVAPTIDIEDEPPARRADTLIPPDSMGSPPPPPLSPVRIPPLISLLDMYASPLPDDLLPSHPSFPRRLYGGTLPESTSSSLEPRVVVPSAGTSGSRRHCITGTIRSRRLTTLRRPPSPTTGDNLSSRLPTLVPHSGSLERVHASLRDFQELISESAPDAPDRTRMAHSSLEPSQVSSPSQRTGISCSSSTYQTQPQRSELYQPPPLPRFPRFPHPTSLAQPAPQVRHIQPLAFCLYPSRRATLQESIIIHQATQTREGPLRDSIPGRRLLSEQGEERHLSSIPDFESEILLDFIGCR
ncbi:unnamed protein product [Rhizoctonia solani]|uniref:RING-type domain-containing protein n=1 Tax=Rhizoctonia solani TaxID=456999 RepID=A0A8H3A2M6_9AGAM|nr:unnamed protein product [Rhizoctonia solani]